MASMGLHRRPVRDPDRGAATPGDHRFLHTIRLDDVFLRWGLAAAVLLKAADQWMAGHHVAAAVLLAAGVVCVPYLKVGAGVAAVGLLPVLDANHAVFLMLVSLIVAVFDGNQRVLLLRTQLTAVYLFAGVAKASSPGWWSGDAILMHGEYSLAPLAPLELVLGGTVAAEIGMAAALWLTPRAARWVGTIMHAAITVGMWTAIPDKIVPLLLFNALAVAVLWAVTRHQLRETLQT